MFDWYQCLDPEGIFQSENNLSDKVFLTFLSILLKLARYPPPKPAQKVKNQKLQILNSIYCIADVASPLSSTF